MTIKLASLNVCLGLSNKKILIEQLIIEKNIDVCAMQEIELSVNFNHNLLSFPGYALESESNNVKSRVGLYINSKLNYIRRPNLEGINSHVVVIDLTETNELRIINVYRSFNPTNGMNPKEFFIYQLNLIKSAYTNNCVIMGDFNLDLNKKGKATYPFKSYFEEMDMAFQNLSLTQIIDFSTWSRCINNVHQESILDHIYCSNPVTINNLYNLKPIFGDHQMLIFNIIGHTAKQIPTIRRSWMNYTKANLCAKLAQVDWNINIDDVQGFWNSFENKLINVIDEIVPMKPMLNNVQGRDSIPRPIKLKINQRKRLLFAFKKDKNPATKLRIKELDKAIKCFFTQSRTKRVRKMIVPGSTNSLWNAVKAAKNVNVTNLPKTMFLQNEKINADQVPDQFANHFDAKIRNILENVSINDEVYNGIKKINGNNHHFMDRDAVKTCIQSLKIKNSEGFDRIPQRILVDGADLLVDPITVLMDKIYLTKSIPKQWLVSKTIPVFKNKGNSKDIENYRPIANLCSTSKIFEKLILKRILELQEASNIDLTGVNQHGFKKGKSTTTLSIELQSLIARALDEDQIGLVASLDLSSAFDVVNVNLLLKRLKIMGLPSDVIELISVWLRDRSFYVSVEGSNSITYDILLGTVQGSILGPVLYAIYVSPLSDIEFLLTFADDNYIPRFDSSIEKLKTEMQVSLLRITKWLRDSGLSVNKNKTELCLFSRHQMIPVGINLEDAIIMSKSEMNVLGIQFDSGLKWSSQVANAILKSQKALNAIKIIRKHFNTSHYLK